MAQETEGHAVPPQGLDWWATVRDALPEDDVLAAAVAEEPTSRSRTCVQAS